MQGLTHYLGKGRSTCCCSPCWCRRWPNAGGRGSSSAAPPARALVRRVGRSAFHGLAGAGSAVRLGLIGGELVKRSYIVVGMVALLLLLALSLTSIPALLRRMGPAWQKLHNWIYAVALLVPVHYWWSLKSGWQEPLIYLLLACALLVPRRDKLLRPWRRLLPQKLREA